jgi:dipeptidyl-peptidase-4
MIRAVSRRLCRRPFAVILVLVVASSASAQLPGGLDEKLEAIYEANAFAAAGLGQVAWLDGGSRFVAPVADRGLIAYTSATGADEVLVSTADLTPAGGRPLAVSGYSFSAAGDKVLIFTNTRRVWRQNTRGDYWVFDRQRRSLTKLGGDAPEASLMFAKLSTDGRRAAYVRDRNLYVETLDSKRIVPLTRDGGEDIVNGTSDWVNEEELGLRDGFRWSPDGQAIAYWQFDTSGVERFTLINNTDARYPRLLSYPYPKAGTRNSAVRIGVVAAGGGATTWMKTPGDPRDHYIPRLQWIDAATVAFHYTNRAQTENRMLVGAAATGAVTEVFRETGQAWLDSVRGLTGTGDADPASWFGDRREFTWITDKDGWSHVYAVDRTNRRDRLLTAIPGDVIEVESLDERGNRLYFIASPDDATQRYLYSAPLSGAAPAQRLTPRDHSGTHGYDISPDGRWALHTYSTVDSPPRIDLISLPDHKVVRPLVDNDALRAKMAPMLRPPVEFVRVEIPGGVSIDGYVVKPRSFDPQRSYPVIVYVYGEVAGVTVMDRWLGAAMLFQRALADEGYVVVSFDNRGTPAPKGARWRKTSYRAVNHHTAAEQAAALRALAASRRYLDLNRVGIYGTSGGGSNTLHALFREPDLFTVGVAMAPLPDQTLYDTIYQERYSGLPDVDRDSYFNGSAVNFAAGLRGKLLLMHGTGDDNVHIQGTERLVNRLVELGKDFDLMIYPNRTHAMSEGPGTTLHRWRTVARYFLQHLSPER